MENSGEQNNNVSVDRVTAAIQALNDCRQEILTTEITDPQQAAEFAFRYATRKFQSTYYADTLAARGAAIEAEDSDPASVIISNVANEFAPSEVHQALAREKQRLMSTLRVAQEDGDYRGLKAFMKREAREARSIGGRPKFVRIDGRVMDGPSHLEVRLRELASLIPNRGVPLTPPPAPWRVNKA